MEDTTTGLVVELWHLLLAGASAVSLFSLLYMRIRTLYRDSKESRDNHAEEVAAEALRRADIERRLAMLEEAQKATNEGVVRSIQNIEKCVGQMQEKSSEARRDLYERIDKVRKEIADEVKQNRAEFTERLDRLATRTGM